MLRQSSGNNCHTQKKIFENKCAKFRANVETGEDDDDEGNEDIFNNEAMEYPADSSSSLGAPKNEPSENEQNLFFS